MAKVLLIHWGAEEAALCVERLEGDGHTAKWMGSKGKFRIREANVFDPDLIVIDLHRLPSHGAACGEFLRTTKRFAKIPIIFAKGDPVKMAALQKRFAGDRFCDWSEMEGAIKTSLANGIVSEIVPRPHRSLVEKLGLKPNSKVYLVDAPREFFLAVGETPVGMEWVESPHGVQLGFFFLSEPGDLLEKWSEVAGMARRHPVWIVYRKGVFKMPQLRDQLRAAGLIDYKVCAIHDRFAGLLVSRARQ